MVAGQERRRKSDEEAKLNSILSAFSTWSHRDSEIADMAPDMLRFMAVKTSGDDMQLLTRLNQWLEMDWKYRSFDEILDEMKFDTKFVHDWKTPPQPNRFSGMKKDWLLFLDETFPQNYSRWERAKQDQFVILALISMRPEGEKQGRLVHLLGINEDGLGSAEKAGDTIRAGKTALSRMANPVLKEGLFALGKGHGESRLHLFENQEIRELTQRWVTSHPAWELVARKQMGDIDIQKGKFRSNPTISTKPIEPKSKPKLETKKVEIVQ